MAAIDVIQATLAPAFLISGTSIFLNFTQTRLFRVLDRMRALAKEGALPEEVRLSLLRRAKILRNSIALGVFTVALTVATAIFLMGEQLAGFPWLAQAAPAAFAVSMLTLFVALTLTLADTILSVRSVEREQGPPGAKT